MNGPKHEAFKNWMTGIAAISATFSLFVANNANNIANDSNRRIQALEENTLFIESLFNSINHLAAADNPPRRIMAINSLHEFIKVIDEKDKKDTATKATVRMLFAADLEGNQLIDEFKILCTKDNLTYCLDLVNKSVDENKDEARTKVKDDVEKQVEKAKDTETAGATEEASAKPPENAKGLATLKLATDKLITKKSNKEEKWIYIGITDKKWHTALDSNRLQTLDKKDLESYENIKDLKRLPQINKTYSLATNVNLRKSHPVGPPPKNFGDIIGVLRKNSQVTIQKFFYRAINPNDQDCNTCQRAVWAQVEIIPKGESNN